jgi:hypothetical protein
VESQISEGYAYYNKETITGMLLSTGFMVGIHRQAITRDMYNQMAHNKNGGIYCQHTSITATAVDTQYSSNHLTASSSSSLLSKNPLNV